MPDDQHQPLASSLRANSLNKPSVPLCGADTSSMMCNATQISQHEHKCCLNKNRHLLLSLCTHCKGLCTTANHCIKQAQSCDGVSDANDLTNEERSRQRKLVGPNMYRRTSCPRLTSYILRSCTRSQKTWNSSILWSKLCFPAKPQSSNVRHHTVNNKVEHFSEYSQKGEQ